MSDTAVHNAKKILTEALDTIKATFWISGAEFKFASANKNWNDETQDYDRDWAEWEQINKAILAELDYDVYSDRDAIERGQFKPDGESKKVKVTGVCSIGALALANVTLYDEPLAPWDAISARDPQSWLAGQALAQVILDQDSSCEDPDERTWWMEEQSAAGGIIAAWNDRDDRTREEVIDAFTKALEHPLLTATEVWQLTYSGAYGSRALPYYFTTEADGLAFLADSTNPLSTWVKAYFPAFNGETTWHLRKSDILAGVTV